VSPPPSQHIPIGVVPLSYKAGIAPLAWPAELTLQPSLITYAIKSARTRFSCLALTDEGLQFQRQSTQGGTRTRPPPKRPSFTVMKRSWVGDPGPFEANISSLEFVDPTFCGKGLTREDIATGGKIVLSRTQQVETHIRPSPRKPYSRIIFPFALPAFFPSPSRSCTGRTPGQKTTCCR